MERRGSNTWLVAVLAVAVGFLAALLIFGGDDSTNTSATVSNGTTAATGTGATTQGSTTATPGTATTTTTTTTGQTTTPATPEATTSSCIALWNNVENRGNQTFLVNQATRQAVRVNVGTTSSVPPQCLVTIVGNNGDAWTIPEGGGTTFPYAPAPGQTRSSELPAAQKISNALEQGDGTLKAR